MRGEAMSNTTTIMQVKSIMDKLNLLAEMLDEKGISEQIPFVQKGSSLKDTIKVDIMLLIFSTIGEDTISPECVEYLNATMGYNFTQLTAEIARKKTLDAGLPHICFLLPFFILLDAKIGGNAISNVYLQTITLVSLGYLKCKDDVSVQEMVNLYRYILPCREMVEETLGEKLDHDPMDMFDSEKRDLIECAIEVDKKIHAENPAIGALREAVKKAVQEKKEEVIEEVDPEEEIFYEPDIVKDLGDGSDLNDEEDDAAEIDFNELPAVQELNQMVGLSEAKNQVNALINMLRIQKRCEVLGIKRKPITYHMVFTGNPGTGKTSVARLMADIYREIGLLSKGHLVEVSRADLVGKYVGHTAVMVKEAMEKAKGGILFIDEAYSLVNGDGSDFGHEAVETLLKEMEDNRSDLVVIVAGYPALMQEFLDSNPGLRSRFPNVIHFANFSENELARIFRKFCRENSIHVSKQVMDAVKKHFAAETAHKVKNFGNAREVRNYFEQAMINQANRLIQSGTMDEYNLCNLLVEDLPQKTILKPYNLMYNNL